jgi:predicted O-methyltransferase YrrM
MMFLSKQDIEFVSPTAIESDILNNLECPYQEFTEMSVNEQEFLNALVLRKKPSKALELGVSAGGSSVIMLNALRRNDENYVDDKSVLYSIDINERWYKDSEKKTGWLVDDIELKERYRLYTGGLALEFIEDVGSGIDFCLLDTVHYNPGEILDYLMILPYLNDDALLVFHDVKHHLNRDSQKAITNCMLVSAISGKKLISDIDRLFSSLVAIQLDGLASQRLYEAFNLLTIQWNYLPNACQQSRILDHFEKHYGHLFVDYMRRVFEHQKCLLDGSVKKYFSG